VRRQVSQSPAGGFCSIASVTSVIVANGSGSFTTGIGGASGDSGIIGVAGAAWPPCSCRANSDRRWRP